MQLYRALLLVPLLLGAGCLQATDSYDSSVSEAMNWKTYTATAPNAAWDIRFDYPEGHVPVPGETSTAMAYHVFPPTGSVPDVSVFIYEDKGQLNGKLFGTNKGSDYGFFNSMMFIENGSVTANDVMSTHADSNIVILSDESYAPYSVAIIDRTPHMVVADLKRLAESLVLTKK